jgi:hypothetical protein
MLVAADNALPHRDIRIAFKYDPSSDDLEATPLKAPARAGRQRVYSK